ncbi:golgin subfamily A member 6-like protein 25 [Nothobranchius furzeri]|uniref:golgin subfamily A member 6-like protein 25 n=1 Tax=Nothobranchius furzeri TaxID=105023 RepID=UPI003904C142
MCLDQTKQDIEVMRNRFSSLMSTLNGYDKFVSQVTTERSQKIVDVCKLKNAAESGANEIQWFIASADAKLVKNKDQLICDLRRQLQSAMGEFDQKHAWPYQETRPAPQSDTVQFSGNCISALQNAVIDSENKISRLNELLKTYTKEIEQNLQFSKEHSTAAQKDRELSTLFEQVETLKTELETTKNKARETEKELKQANVSVVEKDELVSQVRNKLGNFKTDIFRLQSAFEEFCKWKNQIRANNDKTETWFSVVEHLEIRIKDLVEESEDMTVFKQRTAYAPKLHEPLTDLSHTKERTLEMGCGIKNTTKINDEEEIKLQELKDKERFKELQNSEAALHKEVSDLQDKCSQYDEKIASLSGDIEKVEREKISAERFSEELKQKNQELQALINSLKDRCQKQKEKNEGMQESHLQETKRQQLEIKQLTDSLEKKESTIQECQNKLAQTMVGHEEVRQKHEKELAQLAFDSKSENKKYIDEICQLKENIEELESITFQDFRPDTAEKLDDLTVELLISQEMQRRSQEEKDKLQKECEELKEQIKHISADNKMSGSKNSLSKTYSDCTSPRVRKISKSSMSISTGNISPKDQANKLKDLELLIPDLGFTDVVRKDAPCSSDSDDKLSLFKKGMTSTFERENRFSEEISKEPQSDSDSKCKKRFSKCKLSKEPQSGSGSKCKKRFSMYELSDESQSGSDGKFKKRFSMYELSDESQSGSSDEPQSGSGSKCKKRFSEYELSDEPQSGSSDESQSGSDSKCKKRFSMYELSDEPQSGSDSKCKKRFSMYELSDEPQSGSSDEPQSGSGSKCKKRFSEYELSDEPQSGSSDESQSGSDSKCKKRFSMYELSDEPQSGSGSKCKKRFSMYELSDEPQSGSSDEPQSGSSDEPRSGSDSERKKRFSKCKLSKEPQSGSGSKCKKRFSMYELSDEPQSGSGSKCKKRFSMYELSDEPQSGSSDEPQSGSDSERKKGFSEYELSDESQSGSENESDLSISKEIMDEPWSGSGDELEESFVAQNYSGVNNCLEMPIKWGAPLKTDTSPKESKKENKYSTETATVITDLSFTKKIEKQGKRKQPKWKADIEKDILKKRKDLSLLTEIEKGTITNKRKERQMKKRYNIQDTTDIVEAKEKLKQQIQAKAQRIRRYEKRSKHFRHNNVFKVDPKKFYKELGKKQIEIKELPSLEKVEEFWSNVWEKEKNHNEAA